MKTKNYLLKIASAFLFLFAINSNANNLTITGTSVSGSNVTFNISWDNSWNASVAPANWDAVWVFIKYQDCNTRLWAHAGLSTLATDHTAGTPLQVDTVTDGKGVFIRRSALGGGIIGATSITLKMTIPVGTYNYKVFGIEMVNVPQGDFDLGDGISTSTYNSISINATAQSGGLIPSVIGGASAAIPSTFPMGYNSLYCMKYEVSQEQYVEFLNSLTYDQQKSRVVNDPISAVNTYAMYSGFVYRNTLRVVTPGNNAALPAVYGCNTSTNAIPNEINDGQNIAMGGISWGDLSAYLDWAALRPMTELEFEKVCRGISPRVAGEYPWGTTAIHNVYSDGVALPYRPDENYTTVLNGNCAVGVNTSSGIYGPLRCGIFATGSTGRASSGASYYGAMEMGGNVSEKVITTYNSGGTSFDGTLGDGTLTSSGDANQATWPSPFSANGTGNRGGNYSDAATLVRTSDRGSASTVDATRSYKSGGRGVR